jgi:7-carboxy-7-deazaguanine synthase
MTSDVGELRPADPRLGLPAAERLRVNEIFYSIQGESTFAGRPCVLIRLTGCQMRCVWCDSEYSFYEGDWMSLDEILGEVARFGCTLVEVTGGEPLLQPGAFPLMSRLCDAGHEVLIETGGGVDISAVDRRVRRILDIKCPGSGEAKNNRWENLELLTGTDEVKFVVTDRSDYDWARHVVSDRILDRLCPVHFTPVGPPGGSLDPALLASWILEDRLSVRLNLQVHKWLWGAETRGV